MTPERWGEIKQIYHSALGLEPGRREEFLKEACADDASLLKEVTSLLAQEGNRDGLFESPALEAVAQALGEHKAQKVPDLAGRTLLHYRIEEKIGQGGMGEVYRARDTNLDRTVALKILPPAFASNPDRMRRFIREAKAASALSHPNVATIHEVGEAEDVRFIVMEYVNGQTLSEYSRKRALDPGQIVDIGIQMADALEEAHGRGIIHRDLKPANVMVTARGQVKVLDFGLAKLVSPAGEPGESSPSSLTESGLIIGTAASMSPEQVLGHQLDQRTDIFSLGSILYELATGHSPFAGGTTTEIMDRILHTQPDGIARFNPKVPPELERIVRKCLEKDRERRYQSARDLLIDLQNLKRDLDFGTQAIRRRRSWLSVPVLTVTAIAVLALAVVSWLWLGWRRSAESEPQLVPVPLTSYPGFEHTPSFSPDGMQVAFQWHPEGPGANCDIWVKQLGVEPPFRLTSDPAEDLSPAWSPDGRFIAFLRRISPNRASVIIIPQRGGRERLMGEADLPIEEEAFGPYAAWSPDSKWLVFPSAESDKVGSGLVMLSLETLEKRRVTSCPADSFDTGPAFSPDGRTLAFTRTPDGDLFMLQLGNNYEPQAAPERIVAGRLSAGPAWAPDGRDILFSSEGGLWRMPVSVSASPQRLGFASDAFIAPAVSRLGNRLAYAVGRWETNIWQVNFRTPGLDPGPPSKLIASTRMDNSPAYSSDGKRIAFYSDRSGSGEIWACDSDGSNAVQLTQLTSLGGLGGVTPDSPERIRAEWSPDGRSIAFGLLGEAFAVNVNGGVARRIIEAPGTQPWPSWSRDGRWIYFRSHRSGPSEIWKMPAGGGDAIQVTSHTGDLPEESPDGKFLYYMKGDHFPERCSVWRMPTEGGTETRVLDSTICDGPFALAEPGIYFLAKTVKKDQIDLCFLLFATGKTRKIRTFEHTWLGVIAASPDGRTVLYTQADQEGSDLMLVENFR